MMDTQLRLIAETLNKNGYSVIFVDAPSPFLFIDVIICDYEIRLKCTFPIGFPYVFPKIYILEEFYRNIKYLPHILPSGYICTFDSDISSPNPYKAYEIVLNSIEKAIRIIDDGINKKNINDFKEEFESYWMMDEKVLLTCYSLFIPNQIQRLLYYYKDTESLDFFVSDNPDKIINWMPYRIRKSVQLSDLKRCLYIPLDFIGFPPYPRNNFEVYKMMTNKNPYSNEFFLYMRRTKGEKLVLFSHLVDERRNVFGWRHMPFKMQKMNGFRPGYIDPKILMCGPEKDTEIHRFIVESLSNNRLFYRGGDGMEIPDKKVSVTGCGSIGSFLIDSLSKLGINDFLLIDNDLLSSDNIARHICGAFDIGSFKTEAIKKKLINHFPDMKCEGLSENVWNIIEKRIEILNEKDFNFVVVGDIPIELKFMELLKSGEIKKPVIIIWVEPYILGGHCIILQKQEDVITKLYDEKFAFIYRILEDSTNYIKKESGCSSTFVPYSAFEIQQFINSFLDYFNDKFIKAKQDGNYLFSWAGKLTWARNNNFDITPKWLAKNDRDILCKRLDE